MEYLPDLTSNNNMYEGQTFVQPERPFRDPSQPPNLRCRSSEGEQSVRRILGGKRDTPHPPRPRTPAARPALKIPEKIFSGGKGGRGPPNFDQQLFQKGGEGFAPPPIWSREETYRRFSDFLRRQTRLARSCILARLAPI